jgi:putative hydrolase of the HAD superfamily
VVNSIRAVVWDMGGTLEELYYDEAIQQEATLGLRDLLAEWGLDPGLGLDGLKSAVLSGIKAYQAWREEREIELPPERVWQEHVFPDQGLPPERLAAAAEDLTFFYETHYQLRRLRPEAPSVLKVLHRKGFRLAIISNTISRRLVQAKLADFGIARYFDPVVTSSNFGWRKPNERIFYEATRLMGLLPAACAYVGDTVSRDVIGARRAGYGLAIQIESFLTAQIDQGIDDVRPDAVIHDLMEVAGLVSPEGEVVNDH